MYVTAASPILLWYANHPMPNQKERHGAQLIGLKAKRLIKSNMMQSMGNISFSHMMQLQLIISMFCASFIFGFFKGAL